QAQELTVDGQAPGADDEMRTVFNDPTTFNVKHPLYSAWTLWFDSPSTKGRTGGTNPPFLSHGSHTHSMLGTGTPATPSTAVPPTPSGTGWMDDIKKVIRIESVEEFWGLYNNIVEPSKLPQKANYYLFKESIIPAWEDAANKDGGKWSIQLPKDKNRANVDKMWLYTMLAAIGETFDPYLTAANANPNPDEPAPTSLITGVIVSTRPQFYRLSIWTRAAPTGSGGAEDEKLRARVEAIGKHFKTQVLGYGESQKLGGPLATDVEFVSHKDSEKKGKGKKIVI
ncbi:hypothetical protein M408DRAFT_62178, partial [Serendipita vermifera MAFF 305830]